MDDKTVAELGALLEMNRLVQACQRHTRRLRGSEPELVEDLQGALVVAEISLLRLIEAADSDAMADLLD